jgi:hypothetical protein
MTAPAPTAEQLRARALARSRRTAIRLRARRIRRLVAGLAVTLFATAFLIVYVQLASGHDPALVANAAKRHATSVSASQSSAGDASESTSDELGATEEATGAASETSSSTGDPSSAARESSSGASAVTTSQS